MSGGVIKYDHTRIIGTSTDMGAIIAALEGNTVQIKQDGDALIGGGAFIGTSAQKLETVRIDFDKDYRLFNEKLQTLKGKVLRAQVAMQEKDAHLANTSFA